MKHTYFFQSLDWKASGTYYDEKGNKVPLYGEVSIIKNEEEWSLGGFMEVKFKTPVRFTNGYKITSTSDPTTLSWESYNPALGTLRGTFEVVGDAILSQYVSEDRVYSGNETLKKLSDTIYYNVGVSFCKGKKMSSWNAILHAVREEKEY